MHNTLYSTEAVLTADGCVSEVAALSEDGCCPPDVCNIDPCGLMCSFISLLPNGPMWDRAKAEGMSRYDRGGVCEGGLCNQPPGECATMVDFAAYSGLRLYNLIGDALWPALREASPETAVQTLDSWLDLYGWESCWESSCRDNRLGPSPYECTVQPLPLSDCFASVTPISLPDAPVALTDAVKRGIVRALYRMQMSPIKNMCGINWVIAPLGAALRVPAVPKPVNNCCDGMQWEIYNTSQNIEALPSLQCAPDRVRYVKASFQMKEVKYNPETFSCEQTGPELVTVWPGVLAAQCIALSMMPLRDSCAIPIVRATA